LRFVRNGIRARRVRTRDRFRRALARVGIAFLLLPALTWLLAGCGSTPSKSTASTSSSARYYKDDGPGEAPGNLDSIPDAVPRVEPLNRFANRPYTVLGREYVPATSLVRYKERGIASWYGRKFHGQKTSIGETYDMYAMTAAHPTLPLPSYARVTNVATGQSVVVRVNDRGPFLYDRIIDLSYAAAHRIGVAQRGSGMVEVEAILPADVTATRVATLAPVNTGKAPPSTVVVAAEPSTSSGVVTAPVTPPPVIQGTNVATAPSTPQLAPASPPVSPAANADVSPLAGGYAVQLGAFANFANAQSFLAHAQNQLATLPVEAKIRQAGGLFRVYVGPYADRDEARRVGERITQAFGMETAVAPH
jgi:rare lipoprotein A